MGTAHPSAGVKRSGDRNVLASSRREFTTALGAAAIGLAWPRAARAQQRPAPVVGFLRSTSAGNNAHLVAALWRGLNEGGFFEDQNLTVEYRYADNDHQRLPQLAAELVRLRASVVIGNSVSIRAMMNASSTMPCCLSSAPIPKG